MDVANEQLPFGKAKKNLQSYRDLLLACLGAYGQSGIDSHLIRIMSVIFEPI